MLNYKQVVIFENRSTSSNDHRVTAADNSDDNESGAAFLIRILRYLETPQYLRKSLFPKHNNLRFVVRTVSKFLIFLKLYLFLLFSKCLIRS